MGRFDLIKSFLKSIKKISRTRFLFLDSSTVLANVTREFNLLLLSSDI